MVDGSSDDIKKVMSEAKRLAQRGGGGPRGGKSNESAMVIILLLCFGFFLSFEKCSKFLHLGSLGR